MHWSDLSGMSVLVTGAAGGVGAVLVPALTVAGARVFAVDDLSSGRWENLGDAASHIVLADADVRNAAVLEETIPWASIDAVVHLAAISSLPACESDPAHAFDVNVVGTAVVCDLARRYGVGYFINASTSAIYERTPGLPFREEMPVRPVLVYPQTKWAAEQLVTSLGERFGMSVGNLRFFNLFGSYQDYRRLSPPLLNYLVRQALRGEKALLHSDGRQQRDYVSTEAACDAIGLLLRDQPAGAGCWNVCSGQTFSVRDIVEIVDRALDVSLEVVYRDARLLWDRYADLFEGPRPLAFDVVSRETEKTSLGDPSALRAAVGWAPDESVPEKMSEVARGIAAHIAMTGGLDKSD